MTHPSIVADAIYCISDVHFEYKKNKEWISSLSDSVFKDSVLMIAGDVASKLGLLKEALLAFRKKFKAVVFVPGNHDLWLCKESDGVSAHCLDKLDKIKEVISTLDNVFMEPVKIFRYSRFGWNAGKENQEGNSSHHTNFEKAPFGHENEVWIVPLFGWHDPYDSAFVDHSSTLPTKKELAGVFSDYALCRWPQLNYPVPDCIGVEPSPAPCPYTEAAELAFPAKLMCSLNQDALSRVYDAPVISFSHFLPYCFLPPSLFLSVKLLPHAMGTTMLKKQVQYLQSKIHVFGHSHMNVDRTVEGVRYLQCSLGYPTERARWKDEISQPQFVWPSRLSPLGSCIAL
eukprot:GCRY01000232.1.p1 GENE.GCRY01000232.1~~GCRY01000232.1.p1  ORF type:complete len:343 (+),score=63.53 GCRY01000232.1:185-1213(+)